MEISQFEFLIRINESFFLSGVDGRQISGTPVPSAASHFDYRSADRICAGLRAHGYPQAHVTDNLGSAITREMLQAALAVERVEADDLPRTLAELDKIPSSVMKRRMRGDPEFAKRVADLYAKPGKK